MLAMMSVFIVAIPICRDEWETLRRGFAPTALCGLSEVAIVTVVVCVGSALCHNPIYA